MFQQLNKTRIVTLNGVATLSVKAVHWCAVGVLHDDFHVIETLSLSLVCCAMWKSVSTYILFQPHHDTILKKNDRRSYYFGTSLYAWSIIRLFRICWIYNANFVKWNGVDQICATQEVVYDTEPSLGSNHTQLSIICFTILINRILVDTIVPRMVYCSFHLNKSNSIFIQVSICTPILLRLSLVSF